MSKRFLVPVVGALLTLGVADAAAQTTANADATITIGEVLYINVSNTSVTFPNPSTADFQSGSVQANSGSSSLDHAGNVTHTVQVTADAANMSDSGGASAKPASDLQWSTDAGGSWTGLSTTAADIVTSAAPGSYTNAETIDYQILLDYATDAPETYTLNFTYTVVAG